MMGKWEERRKNGDGMMEEKSILKIEVDSGV